VTNQRYSTFIPAGFAIILLGVIAGSMVMILNAATFPLFDSGTRFNSLEEVAIVSQLSSPVFTILAILFMAWLVAFVLSYKLCTLSFTVNSPLAQKAPWAAFALISFYIGGIYPAFLFMSAVSATALNASAWLFDFSFVYFNNSLVNWSQLGETLLALFGTGLIISMLAAVLNSDFMAVFRIGKSGLQASISPSGKKWQVHLGSSDRNRFSTAALLESCKELNTQLRDPGTGNPEIVVMDSWLLANKAHRGKHHHLLEVLCQGTQYEYIFAANPRPLGAITKLALWLKFPAIRQPLSRGDLNHSQAVSIIRKP